MDLIIIIIAVILGIGFKDSIIGRILIFFAFMIIICGLFGKYIPFSDVVSQVIKFGSVLIIILIGAGCIFMSGKKD